jgi:hypothetical protein
MTDLPTTQEQAKEQQSKHYFTGKECKHSHVSKRYTLNGKCVECAKMFTARHYEKHPESKLRDRARSLEYQKNNRDKMNAYHKKWRTENPDKWKALMDKRNAKRKSPSLDK